MKVQQLLDLIEKSGIKPYEEVQFKYKNTEGNETDLAIDCITIDTFAHGTPPIRLNTIIMLEIF